MVLIIVMGGNVIVFFHGGVSLLTGIAHSPNFGKIRQNVGYHRYTVW